MINFQEELAKFEPSLEIEQAEEIIVNNELKDLQDVLEKIISAGKEN